MILSEQCSGSWYVGRLTHTGFQKLFFLVCSSRRDCRSSTSRLAPPSHRRHRSCHLALHSSRRHRSCQLGRHFSRPSRSSSGHSDAPDIRSRPTPFYLRRSDLHHQLRARHLPPSSPRSFPFTSSRRNPSFVICNSTRLLRLAPNQLPPPPSAISRRLPDRKSVV